MCCVNWTEVEAIGTWVAGIGTIGTVLVALFLARKSTTGKIRLVAGLHSVLQQSLAGENTRDILFLGITNVGSRNLNIDRIAWRLGKQKRTRLVFFQLLKPSQVYSLPKTLSDGENIYFEFEKDEWIRSIVNQIGNKDLSFLETKVLETLQFGASATNGQDFWQDAESGLKSALIKEAQSFLSKSKAD